MPGGRKLLCTESRNTDQFEYEFIAYKYTSVVAWSEQESPRRQTATDWLRACACRARVLVGMWHPPLPSRLELEEKK